MTVYTDAHILLFPIQIIQARDLVESSIKPGSSSLQILAAVTPLIRKLGRNADPSNLRRLPIAAVGFGVFYAAYSAYILLGSDAPGLPAWQTSPETLTEVFNLSLNFFYVNIGLNAVGLSFIQRWVRLFIASEKCNEAYQ